MSELPSSESRSEISATEDADSDDAKHVLVRYSVELESLDGHTRRRVYVDAGSLDEALAKGREEAQVLNGDPSRLRVVAISEENASGEHRRQRDARRRYINTIVENGLTVLGKPVPGRSDQGSCVLGR
ncbi:MULTISPECIES: hypothetical protein [Streptomyces]|uniref:hypothetical protein n=1 Tax=Streptomyces TaxID=1883 RepID=UPI0015F92EC7|nr:hypothetical protein [Streptomyces sp. GMR22]MBA6436964.1 hypothetical protein [Streptomyces sp. GMR22]